MKGLNENIGPQVAPEDIKQLEDRPVQMKANRYWAEEEVRT